MNSEEIYQRILKLNRLIHEHNHRYYVLNKPTISDYDFDQLLKELMDLEALNPEYRFDNSPTTRVGSDISKKFNVVRHNKPMLSLSNSYSEEEVEEWCERVKKNISIKEKLNFSCELKYDGVAICIHYKEGKLIRAITRGDGEQGEDVTNNVKTIQSIPLQLSNDFPENLEIRGEIFLTKSQFEKINSDRIKNNEEPFANPRNTASGSLKLLDSNLVAKRKLDCYLYNLDASNSLEASHYKNVLNAANWGFKVPNISGRYIEQCDSVKGVFEFINYWKNNKDNLPFDIDGIVIKVDNYQLQEILGSTSKSPRWAIAYKFKAERKETNILSIDYQVGRTGSITPVANLKSVLIGGTVVKRASLHNEDQIKKLDLHENDIVFIEKGGEIIPKIVGVKKRNRKIHQKPFQFIQNCPDCNFTLVKKENEANHYCLNEWYCHPQIKGKIEHFVSRKAMDIEGLGSETIDLMIRNNLLRKIEDIYTLDFDAVQNLERMAIKSSNNLLQSIEQSKTKEFDKVLFALGIRFVGETVAKTLAKSFKSLELLRQADKATLMETEEIGEKIADSIISYFQNENNNETILKLMKVGIKMEITETNNESDLLVGKTIVISGVFEKVSRDELKLLIEKHGGKNSSSISAKTNFLVSGENMGPSKLKKATSLGVKIIKEKEFLSLIGYGI